MSYRIITELKNKNEIAGIVSQFFTGFTLIEGEGYWKTRHERSLIIDVETTEGARVKDAAMAIKRHNEQEQVLVQKITDATWFV